MSPDLTESLERFEKLQDDLLDVGARMMQAFGGAIYPLDLLANAALKRALSLNAAFAMLLRSSNFLAAAHLVRLQLDSVLRLSAAWIVNDCHAFADAVLKGVSVRDQKDKNGTKLTDAYLVSILTKEEPWVESVYKATSGYIHLSEKHIYNTMSFSGKPGVVTIEISAESETIPDKSKLEAILAMTAITRLLERYLEGWYQTKENPKKGAQQGCPPNSHAFGTFGTSPAEQALVPKASGSR